MGHTVFILRLFMDIGSASTSCCWEEYRTNRPPGIYPEVEFLGPAAILFLIF